MGGDAGLGRKMTGFGVHTGLESEAPGKPLSGQARDGCLGASESLRAGTLAAVFSSAPPRLTGLFRENLL